MKKDSGLLYRTFSSILALFLMMAMFSAGFAETERGDLNARFSDEITVTYEDTSYRLKSRITTVLFAGFAAGDDGTYVPEVLVLLTVDDNAKLMTPICLDSALLTEYTPIPMNDAVEFIDTAGIGVRCEELLSAVNMLLPAELAEHYVALDLASLRLLDGLDTPDYLDRMRAIKDRIEQTSSEQLDDIFDRMSGQIVSDLKSGGLIKIADKAERYDRVSMVRFVEQTDPEKPDDREMAYSPEAMLEFSIDVFFEEKELW